ncbi:TetR/AcrR family transcriptional regulator [Nesterenkonia alkaliphila]|uniref:TetR family transcriptional regulator n=1 Tax=Nesterenkonia alkaliphila TaxID=1463631 RepID=A0A7K1UIC7_9MICC|nr:TetR/AcrR family transcriptional regulator [Nesterenkonia alkaliphila]MVT25861.1 TetR family transcriptional regulator [Nesterenkonia alkaliphila]GFZ76576.1 TetR family transcriptional regulator [Nesterenkonia alkaliphila]
MTTAPASEPGRAKRLPREQRRAQLLDCALRVFVAKGFHAASMDDIAESAQVSKPVLYQHFPGKHELFLDLLDKHLGQLQDELTSVLGGAETNKERVSGTVTAFYEFIARKDEAYRLIFAAGMDNDPTVAERLERFHDALAFAIAEVIADDTGQPMAEATMLGHGLIGMATTAARHWSKLSERPDLETSAQLTSRLAWRGISGFPKESEQS